MQTRIKKVDYVLVEKLSKIDPDFNEGLRKLFIAFRNEASEDNATETIERNEALHDKNLAEIEGLPNLEKEHWENLMKRLLHEKSRSELAIKANSLKLDFPDITNPTYEYENQPGWKELVLSDNRLALENATKRLEEINEQIDNFDQSKLDNNHFEEKMKMLVSQNERILKENERCKKILEMAKILQLEK